MLPYTHTRPSIALRASRECVHTNRGETALEAREPLGYSVQRDTKRVRCRWGGIDFTSTRTRKWSLQLDGGVTAAFTKNRGETQ